MAIRPFTTLRHAITALLLLAGVLVGTEFWMRTRNVPSLAVVTCQATESEQCLLAPSAVTHHELRRSTTTDFLPCGQKTSVTVRVNSLGCRGGEVEESAKIGTRRILLLGDDTICGATVAENETVAAWLKKFLTKSVSGEFEIINGGVPGYCPLLSALQFENDLAKLKPDIVILHVDMTDIADDSRYRSLLLHDGDHAVCTHASFRIPPKPGNSVLNIVKQSAAASWLFAMTRQHGPELLSVSDAGSTGDVGLNWIADNPPDLRLQTRHALQPIRDLRDTVARSGGQLLVTTSPVLWQILPAKEAPTLSRHCGIKGATPFSSQFPFEVLASFCQESSIEFCDASPAFRRDDAVKLFSKEAPVLSKIGMALYAREIARSLIENPQFSSQIKM